MPQPLRPAEAALGLLGTSTPQFAGPARDWLGRERNAYCRDGACSSRRTALAKLTCSWAPPRCAACCSSRPKRLLLARLIMQALRIQSSSSGSNPHKAAPASCTHTAQAIALTLRAHYGSAEQAVSATFLTCGSGAMAASSAASRDASIAPWMAMPARVAPWWPAAAAVSSAVLFTGSQLGSGCPAAASASPAATSARIACVWAAERASSSRVACLQQQGSRQALWSARGWDNTRAEHT